MSTRPVNHAFGMRPEVAISALPEIYPPLQTRQRVLRSIQRGGDAGATPKRGARNRRQSSTSATFAPVRVIWAISAACDDGWRASGAARGRARVHHDGVVRYQPRSDSISGFGLHDDNRVVGLVLDPFRARRTQCARHDPDLRLGHAHSQRGGTAGRWPTRRTDRPHT